MDRHAFAESADFFRKAVAGRIPKPLDPVPQREPHGVEQAFDFLGRQFLRKSHRRELRPVQDFIRIGVANPAEQARVCKGALHGVIFRCELGRERGEVRFKHLDAARVQGPQGLLAGYYVQRCPLL